MATPRFSCLQSILTHSSDHVVERKGDSVRGPHDRDDIGAHIRKDSYYGGVLRRGQ